MSEQVRLVVIDHTAIGDGTATGELKAALLADWPSDVITQVHSGRARESLVVRSGDDEGRTLWSVEPALADILAERPQIGLFRTSADNPKLWDVAEGLAFKHGVPLVIWVMDDWLNRRGDKSSETMADLARRLDALLRAAPVRLAISEPMAADLAEQFALPFEVLANGVLAEEWPDRSGVKDRPERRGMTLLRYAGGLAPDMALDAVLGVARAVSAVAQREDIHLQINTHPHWIKDYGSRFADLRNVSLGWRNLDRTAYRQWISDADVNLLAYNFDETSARYIGTSFANKLPECLASGAALLAVGPSHLNTLAYCDTLPFVYRHAEADAEGLRTLLRYLHKDRKGRRRNGELGRLHAFDAFDLRRGQQRLAEWLRAAALPSQGSPAPRRPRPQPGEDHKRISVVVPNFNGGALLETTLRSILHQGYPNLELIFVDGGSTDESLEIAERYRDQMAVFISEPDEGQGDALQKGFARATGEIMGWMNSDDILMPGSLFTLNRVFGRHDQVDWITGRKTMMLEDGTIYLVDEARPWSRARFLAGDYRYIQQESTFWRRRLWDRAGGYIDASLRLAVDLDLWIRFFQHAALYSLDATVGAFRLRAGQRSAAQRDAYENESVRLLRDALDRVEPSYTERRGDILPTRFEVRDRTGVEQAFPHIVTDDPPVIRFTGNARDFEIMGQTAALPLGAPVRPEVYFDGLHGAEFKIPLGGKPEALLGLRLKVAPAGRAPIAPVNDYDETHPATLAVVGPLMVVQPEPFRIDVVVKTATGTVSSTIGFGRDTVSLDIEVELGREMTVRCNGQTVFRRALNEPLALLLDRLRLGFGLRQRFWFGAVETCELALAGLNEPWNALAPEHWSARTTVSRDFTTIDATPPPGPAAPRPDRLSPLRNRHAGERCFIMGSGPSLNKMDLSLLEGETVISCNASFLLFDRVRWRPRYYTCVDARVLTDRGQEIGEMLSAEPEITGLLPHVVHLHDGSGTVLDTRKLVGVRPNTLFFKEVFNSDRDLPYSMFSTDLNDHVVMPYTVTITMLQIAAYMGFSEIYLIGCDTSYKVIETVVQEGPEAEGGVGLLLTSTADDDPNHFDPRYFGKGRKWHNPQVANMIMHYGYAKQVLDEIGVKVFNATVGGNLEVFPRVDFEALLRPRPDATASPAPAAAAPATPAPVAPARASGAPRQGSGLTVRELSGPDDRGGPTELLISADAADLPEALSSRFVAVGRAEAPALIRAIRTSADLRRILIAGPIPAGLPDDVAAGVISSDWLAMPDAGDREATLAVTALAWAQALGAPAVRLHSLSAAVAGQDGSARRQRLDQVLAALTASGIDVSRG